MEAQMVEVEGSGLSRFGKLVGQNIRTPDVFISGFVNGNNERNLMILQYIENNEQELKRLSRSDSFFSKSTLMSNDNIKNGVIIHEALPDE